MADALKYVPPPKGKTVRRVYVLPVDLVKEVQSFGYQNGHDSEVSAVRALLERALKRYEAGNDAGGSNA